MVKLSNQADIKVKIRKLILVKLGLTIGRGIIF